MTDKFVANPCKEWGCIYNSGWTPEGEAHCTHWKPFKKYGSDGRLVCVTARYHPIKSFRAGRTNDSSNLEVKP